MKNTTTATKTTKANLEAAILAVAEMREANDDWCEFCGEGHGAHEPSCIVTAIREAK